MHDIRYIYDRLSGAKACVYKNIAQRVLAVFGNLQRISADEACNPL